MHNCALLQILILFLPSVQMEGDVKESVSATPCLGSAQPRGARTQQSILDFLPKVDVGTELARVGDRGQAGEGPSDRPLSGRERAFAAEVPVLPSAARGDRIVRSPRDGRRAMGSTQPSSRRTCRASCLRSWRRCYWPRTPAISR